MVLLKTKTGFVRQQRAQIYPYFGNRFDLAQDPDRRHVSIIVEELRALGVLDHGLLNVPRTRELHVAFSLERTRGRSTLSRRIDARPVTSMLLRLTFLGGLLHVGPPRTLGFCGRERPNSALLGAVGGGRYTK